MLRVLCFSFALALGAAASTGAAQCTETRLDFLLLTRTTAEEAPLFSDVINGDAVIYDTEDMDHSIDPGFRVEAIRHGCCGLGAGAGLNYWSFEESDQVTGQANNFDTLFTGFVGFADIEMFQTRYLSETIGAELNLRKKAACYPVTLLVGVRYANVTENADITAQTTGGLVDMLSTRTTNDLIGMQGGFEWCGQMRRWVSLQAFGKAGAYHASMSQSTTAEEPGGIGSQTSVGADDTLAMIVEVGANARVQLTSHLAFRAGYFLNWTENLALAPDQWNNIDFTNGPINNIDDQGGFVSHGLLLGAEGRW